GEPSVAFLFDGGDVTDRIRDAYDPERFRALGHAIVDRLADHLARASAGSGPVVDWKSPQAAVEELATVLASPPAHPLKLLDSFLASSVRQHHPRYVGYQVSAALPVAALFDLVGAILNNGMAAYESGPASTAAERAVVRALCDKAGLAQGDG